MASIVVWRAVRSPAPIVRPGCAGVCQESDRVVFRELEVPPIFVASFVDSNKVLVVIISLIVIDPRARRPCAPPGNPS